MLAHVICHVGHDSGARLLMSLCLPTYPAFCVPASSLDVPHHLPASATPPAARTSRTTLKTQTIRALGLPTAESQNLNPGP
jgi:hypothetical protein